METRPVLDAVRWRRLRVGDIWESPKFVLRVLHNSGSVLLPGELPIADSVVL